METRAKLFLPGKLQTRDLKSIGRRTLARARRSPSSTRATLPSRLSPTARYLPQLPARSPASPRPARNAPRRLAAHENANRRDVCRAQCRLHVGVSFGRTSRGRAAACSRAMRHRVERALQRRRDRGRLNPNRYAPRGRRRYASFPTTPRLLRIFPRTRAKASGRDESGSRGARVPRQRQAARRANRKRQGLSRARIPIARER